MKLYELVAILPAKTARSEALKLVPKLFKDCNHIHDITFSWEGKRQLAVEIKDHGAYTHTHGAYICVHFKTDHTDQIHSVLDLALRKCDDVLKYCISEDDSTSVDTDTDIPSILDPNDEVDMLDVLLGRAEYINTINNK